MGIRCVEKVFEVAEESAAEQTERKERLISFMQVMD